MNKKKRLFSLFAILLVTLFACSAWACGGTTPSHTHALVKIDKNDANCTDDGNIEYWECGGCHKYFSDANGETEITDKTDVVVPAHHSLEKTDKKDATCTDDGNIEYWECGVCHKCFSDANGETEITDKASVVVPAHHSLEKTDKKEANCTDDGNIEYWKCGGCHKYFSDANGETEITDKTSVVVPVHHSLEKTDKKEANCIHDGNIEYWKCSVCDKYFSDANGKTEITEANIAVSATGIHDYENNFCKVCGDKFESIGLKYKRICGSEYEVVGIGTATDTEIIIPPTHNGIAVTRIAANAFYGKDTITSIKIPDSVTTICENAFSACNGLTEVEIPDSVVDIESNAFSSCENLLSFTLGKSVADLEEGALNDCINLATIKVRDGNTKYSASGNCLIETASKRLIVGFADSVIPDDGSVTSIGDQAFAFCEITNITIPDGITSIGNNAFYGSKLTSITLPDSVTSIGSNAFYYCSYLTTVELSKNLTSIGGRAFSHCGQLSSIVIPISVTSIGSSAFEECDELTIYCEAESMPSGWETFWNHSATVVWNYKG